MYFSRIRKWSKMYRLLSLLMLVPLLGESAGPTAEQLRQFYSLSPERQESVKRTLSGSGKVTDTDSQYDVSHEPEEPLGQRRLLEGKKPYEDKRSYEDKQFFDDKTAPKKLLEQFGYELFFKRFYNFCTGYGCADTIRIRSWAR